MKNIKAEIAAAILIAFFGIASFAVVVGRAEAAPTTNLVYQKTILPDTTAKWELGTSTKAWFRVYSNQFCLTADGCISTWPSGSGGSGGWPFTPSSYNGIANQSTTTPLWLKNTSIIASSTNFTLSSTTQFTNTGTTYLTALTAGRMVGTGANTELYSIATGTIAGSGPITATAGQQIIGSGLTIGCTSAASGVAGCMTAADWGLLHTATSTFTAPLAWSGSTNAVTCATCVTSVTGTYPIISSGGTTPTISLGFSTTTANAWSLLQTFANASSSLSTFSGATWFTALSANTLVALDGNKQAYSAATSTLSIGGNAATATALQTARTINGISFDGTANIVVASTTLLSNNNIFSGNNLFSASTTINAQLNLAQASSTVFTATTVCLTGDICRTTWPSGSASTTLLSDNNTFTGTLNTFSNATSTLGTFTTGWIGTLKGNLTMDSGRITFSADTSQTTANSILRQSNTLTFINGTSGSEWRSSGNSPLVTLSEAGLLNLTGTIVVRGAATSTISAGLEGGTKISAPYFNATSTTASSTFKGGVQSPCFSVDGTNCITTGGGGTVTSVTGTYPIISSGGATPAISLAFGTTTANTWSGLNAFSNTGTTTFSGGVEVGTKLAAPYFLATSTSFLNVFPNASTTNLTASIFAALPTNSNCTGLGFGASSFCVDTTSNQLQVGTSTSATPIVYNPIFHIGNNQATSTAWTGTTTLPFAAFTDGGQLKGILCWTDAGTLDVQISYGPSKTTLPMIVASSTGFYFAFSGVGSIGANATSTISIGTPASSPTQIECTADGYFTKT